MKIDVQEFAHLGDVQPNAERLDLYTGIHKALRSMMSEALLGLGRADVQDDLELANACDGVMALLDMCRGHLTHENGFVHRAMEARAPGTTAHLAADHADHEHAIVALASDVAHLMGAGREERAALALALYRQLALFVAHNLVHMHEEETHNNAVLWAHYTDAELAQLHGALVASIPVDETLQVMRWMVPALGAGERLAMLLDMQAHAPAPAFQAVLSHVQPHLSLHDWAKLMRGLGLPCIPGAVA